MKCPRCQKESNHEAKFCSECGLSLIDTLATVSGHEDNPIERIATAVYSPFAMLAGMQLDLFTVLKDGRKSTKQIARAIDVNPAKLEPLLYALVVAGLLNVEGDLFDNTEVANCYLVRGSQSCMVDSHELYSGLWEATLKTAESIRTGLPQAKYDYSAMPKDELGQFLRGEHPEAIAAGHDLAVRFDFSSCRTLIDVGGGSGGLAIALTESCPHIQATVVDLPTVISLTERFIKEAGAEERVRVIGADVIHSSLRGSYDVAVLRAFIQVLSPDDALSALKNVGRVVNPGGAIYITGMGIIDDSCISPANIAMFNLVFTNVYDEGQAYTEKQHRDWLEEAGFVHFERFMLSGGRSIITAWKLG